MADVPNESYTDAGDYAKPITPTPPILTELAAFDPSAVEGDFNEDLAVAEDAVGVTRDWHPASEED